MAPRNKTKNNETYFDSISSKVVSIGGAILVLFSVGGEVIKWEEHLKKMRKILRYTI